MANFLNIGEGFTNTNPIEAKLDTDVTLKINAGVFTNSQDDIGLLITHVKTSTERKRLLDDGDTEPTLSFGDLFGLNATNSGEYKIMLVTNMASGQDPVQFAGSSVLDVTVKASADANSYLLLPFVAKIEGVNGNKVTINRSWKEFRTKVKPPRNNTYPEGQVQEPKANFSNIDISHKTSDVRDLNTYLHFGEDNKLLVTNIRTDDITFKAYSIFPYTLGTLSKALGAILNSFE